jgi:hypothetical protein
MLDIRKQNPFNKPGTYPILNRAEKKEVAVIGVVVRNARGNLPRHFTKNYTGRRLDFDSDRAVEDGDKRSM